MTNRIFIYSLAAVFAAASALISPAALAQGKSQQNADGGPVIGNLSPQISRQLDCPLCSFQLPSERRKRNGREIFVTDDTNNAAWINVDGKTIKIRLVNSKEPRGRERVGSKSSRSYEGSGVTVEVEMVTTKMCKPKDESCESTDYSTAITVTKSGRTRTVKTVGGCGC